MMESEPFELAIARFQSRVLAMVATSAPLGDVSRAIVEEIERLSPEILASILLLDEDGLHLSCCAAPSLPDEYNSAIDGLAIGENAGSCGTAAYRREAVVVTDIAADPLWTDYRHLALPHGLAACWSTPIFGENRTVLGTFAIYTREPRGPQPRDFKLIDAATHLASIAIQRDRSERKHEEITRRAALAEALNQERARMASMLYSAPAAIAVTRGPQHVFEIVNPAFEALTGRPGGSLTGLPLRDVLHVLDSQGLHSVFDGILVSGTPYVATEMPVEFKYAPQGKANHRFLDLLLQPLRDETGAMDGIFLHAVDVTEQVQARMAIVETQKQKDELMVVISHDLKSPLAIIFGHALILLRRLERGQALDLETSRESLRAIQTASRDMTLLIGNLVEAARSREGVIALHRSPTDIVDIVERLVREFRRSDDAHTLRLDLSAESIVGEWDSLRLESIAANLITNALKFSPTGSEVLISVSTDGDDALLVVEDHGIGIPADEIDKVFSRFWRASNAAGQASGSGIGLFGVNLMVQNHGGTISVESQEGVGSRFTVRLPLAVDEGEAIASNATP